MKMPKHTSSFHLAAGLAFFAGLVAVAPSVAAPSPALCEANSQGPESTPFTTSQLSDAMLEVTERLGARLEASATPLEQALAHYLLADTRAERATATLRLQRPDCELNRACGAELKQVERQARAADLRELALLARATKDPEIYGMAYAQCTALPDQISDPSCVSVSAREWRAIAPHRADPLLAVAVQAWQTGDREALDRTLHEIVDLPRAPSTGSLAKKAIATDAFKALSERERSLAAMQLVQRLSSLSLAPLTVHFCSGKEMQDPRRRQLCGGLAARMVDMNASMSDNFEGRRIGKAAGWPRERLAASREIAALKKAVRQTLGTPEDKNCAYLERLGRLAKTTLEQGEVQAYIGYFARGQSKPQP